MRLLAFSGKSQAGKTTAALHCAKTFGGTKIALADSLKEEVATLLKHFIKFRPENLYGSAADREEIFQIEAGEWAACADKDLQEALAPFFSITDGGHTISMTFRTLLQTYGTEYRRNQNRNYWTDRGKERILSAQGHVFVDDIRFPDEVEMIHDLGGMVVRIERPDDSYGGKSDHTSETSLDGYSGFDVTVINGGDVTDLEETVESVFLLVI